MKKTSSRCFLHLLKAVDNPRFAAGHDRDNDNISVGFQQQHLCARDRLVFRSLNRLVSNCFRNFQIFVGRNSVFHMPPCKIVRNKFIEWSFPPLPTTTRRYLLPVPVQSPLLLSRHRSSLSYRTGRQSRPFPHLWTRLLPFAL